jgi:hypothetical protein
VNLRKAWLWVRRPGEVFTHWDFDLGGFGGFEYFYYDHCHESTQLISYLVMTLMT